MTLLSTINRRAVVLFLAIAIVLVSLDVGFNPRVPVIERPARAFDAPVETRNVSSGTEPVVTSDISNVTVIAMEDDSPAAIQQRYRLFPDTSCTCRHPDGPLVGIPHPRSHKLLSEFIEEGPQRRMLIIGDSLPRFVFARLAIRLVKERHVIAKSNDSDPFELSATYGKHVPFINWPPDFVNLSATPRMVLRSETDTAISANRNWTHTQSKAFRPTHIVLNRGPWDIGQRYPHGPRRSMFDFADTLVALRREFPVPVRIAVYGLHKIINMTRKQGPAVDCVYDREHLPYRSAFYCAVRRANAILVRDLGPGALPDGSLIEYLDTYSITQNATRNDTWHKDGLHYDGPVMDRITDGLLELLIEKPNPPPPLVLGGPCEVTTAKIGSDMNETACASGILYYQITYSVVADSELKIAVELLKALNTPWEELYRVASEGELDVRDPRQIDHAVALTACSHGMLTAYGVFGSMKTSEQHMPHPMWQRMTMCQDFIDGTLTRRFFLQVMVPLATPGFRIYCKDLIYLFKFQSPRAKDRVVPPDSVNELCFKAHTEPWLIYQQAVSSATVVVKDNYKLAGGCCDFFGFLLSVPEPAFYNPLNELGELRPLTLLSVVKSCGAKFVELTASQFEGLQWSKFHCNSLLMLQRMYGAALASRSVNVTSIRNTLGC